MFHSNRLTLLALAELWKNVLKLHIFVRLRIATENSSHALSPLQKKSNARASNLLFPSTFEFAISHKQWLQRGGVTPHHTAPMPRCSDRRQHFVHRLISRKLALRCGVVASLARPMPIGLFPSGYVKAKAYTCPWATNSYRIQDCYRQGIAEISTDQCRRTVDHYRHFRFLSFFTHFFKVSPKLVKCVDFAETFTRHFSQPWDKLKQKRDEYTQNCGFYSRFIG